jgi:hypothetical protein
MKSEGATEGYVLELQPSDETAALNPEEYPYYPVTYDPFSISKKWESYLSDPRSQETLEILIDFNKKAVSSGLFDNRLLERKKLYGNDICLQACLLSYSEILGAQREVVDTIGLIDARDLTSFGSLFESYGTQNKRSYQNSMTFTLNWFNRLAGQYENEGLMAKEYFYDFMELGTGYEQIRKRVKKTYGGLLELDFYASYSTGALVLDFKEGKTKLRLPDLFIIPPAGNPGFFSDFLEKDRPFKDRSQFNFILPTKYRGIVLPLVNVSEIEIRGSGGKVEGVFSAANS